MAARILVVEDEGIVARDIEKSLLRLGYTVSAVAASGEDAVRLAGETLPELVLMDIRLAGAINGIEAAGQIRREFHIPVVYLTAYADPSTLQQAKITEPGLTPAARLLTELSRDHESFFDLGLRMSQLHRSYFLELYSPNESRQLEFAQEADASLTEQARIEGADRLTFGEYLAQYFAG